jgi:hypothetical protein
LIITAIVSSSHIEDIGEMFKGGRTMGGRFWPMNAAPAIRPAGLSETSQAVGYADSGPPLLNAKNVMAQAASAAWPPG